jgi:hypothetical protein
MMKVRKVIVVCLFVLSLIPSAQVLSFAIEELDMVWKELDQVREYYRSGQYDRAWKGLKGIRDKIGMDAPPDYGLEYPESVRRAIRYYENLIKDEGGYYDSYSRFTGVIVESFGNYAGYIIVQSGKKRKEFLYDDGLVLNGEGPWEGKKATVYYENDGITYTDDGFSHALKLVIHE